MKTTSWHLNFDKTIEYYSTKSDSDFYPVTVERVGFSKFNTDNSIREEIVVHWTNVFEWADKDSCGGLGLCCVYLSDGTRTFASGLYNNDGLQNVVVGCYGSTWVRRAGKKSGDLVKSGVAV